MDSPGLKRRRGIGTLWEALAEVALGVAKASRVVGCTLKRAQLQESKLSGFGSARVCELEDRKVRHPNLLAAQVRTGIV